MLGSVVVINISELAKILAGEYICIGISCTHIGPTLQKLMVIKINNSMFIFVFKCYLTSSQVRLSLWTIVLFPIKIRLGWWFDWFCGFENGFSLDVLLWQPTIIDFYPKVEICSNLLSLIRLPVEVIWNLWFALIFPLHIHPTKIYIHLI